MPTLQKSYEAQRARALSARAQPQLPARVAQAPRGPRRLSDARAPLLLRRDAHRAHRLTLLEGHAFDRPGGARVRRLLPLHDCVARLHARRRPRRHAVVRGGDAADPRRLPAPGPPVPSGLARMQAPRVGRALARLRPLLRNTRRHPNDPRLRRAPPLRRRQPTPRRRSQRGVLPQQSQRPLALGAPRAHRRGDHLVRRVPRRPHRVPAAGGGRADRRRVRRFGGNLARVGVRDHRHPQLCDARLRPARGGDDVRRAQFGAIRRDSAPRAPPSRGCLNT